MANIQQKNGVFHVRFRFRGKQYKKSLKTRVRKDAQDALTLIAATIVRVLTGQLNLPTGLDPGDFIVSNGTLPAPSPVPVAAPKLPTLREATDRYLESRRNKIEESYRSSMRTHVGHLLSVLIDRAEQPVDRLTHADLERYVNERLKTVTSTTVNRERVTIMGFCKWAIKAGHLSSSPASDWEKLPEEVEPDPFKTMDEINENVGRGSLTEHQLLDAWECLYLSRPEVGTLLRLVRERARLPESHLLHAIPAHTGMRRGEVLKLRWSDINFHSNWLQARSRKQSRTRKETLRQIELSPELKDLLAAWRDSHPTGQFLLTKPGTQEQLDPNRENRLFWEPMRGTEWCLDLARSWFKVGFHTYRHSFASNLACEGVDQRIIDQWMGHETESMRRRYRHLFPNTRQEAIRKVSYALA